MLPKMLVQGCLRYQQRRAVILAVMRTAQVTGDEASEQVLDEVFSRFCIGK